MNMNEKASNIRFVVLFALGATKGRVFPFDCFMLRVPFQGKKAALYFARVRIGLFTIHRLRRLNLCNLKY